MTDIKGQRCSQRFITRNTNSMLFCLSSTRQFTLLGARELLINHAKLNDVGIVLLLAMLLKNSFKDFDTQLLP